MKQSFTALDTGKAAWLNQSRHHLIHRARFMKPKIFLLLLTLILAYGVTDVTHAQNPGTRKAASVPSGFVKDENEEFNAAVALPPASRIEQLKTFVAAHPRSNLKTRAMELIVSAHAELGDAKLKAGDAEAGTAEFKLAVAAVPTDMSDKLFNEVVSQIPSNLFMRGQQIAATEVAHAIEELVKDNGMRMLNLAAFYLGVEDAENALRIANIVIKMSPESSPAYQARAAAHRIALRLEESAADYARALELSSKSTFAKRSLAELRRATGKTDEALTLYRELLSGDPTNEFSRTGLVVSLFELGKKEEAEREFESALKDLPNSLALLSGTAYWFAAHNEGPRAVELAQQAVQLEPRYIWGHIALARGLLTQRRPLDAERVLLLARSYGRFPTLDYEMASVLAAAGLYDEAASSLSSFALKNNQIETWLAGRIMSRADSFTELIAPERRASIFQFTAADSDANARSLKALLALKSALNPSGGREAIKESEVLSAAREFVNGDDQMRAFRRLYLTGRLLEFDVALPVAMEMMEAVTSEVDPALRSPVATIAVIGEELYESRVQAQLHNSTVNVPEIPRDTLANIMRGRIEELAGWTLFHQARYADATVRLRRAVSVLPDASVWWRNSMWRLGASLEADGKRAEALDIYYRSYRSGGPDPTRRAVIENLYRRVNGSLNGLDEKIGSSTMVASIVGPRPSQSSQDTNTESNSGGGIAETKTDTSEVKPAEATPKTEPQAESVLDSKKGTPSEAQSRTTLTSEPSTSTLGNPETTASPVASEPTMQPTPMPSPEQSPVEVPPGPPQPAEGDEPHDTSSAVPTESTAATEPAAKTERRERRVTETKCVIDVSESAITIQNNGGRAVLSVTLDAGTSPNDVTASTSDWSSLAVFPEPKSGSDSDMLVFSVSSISKKTGTFTITFKSPCGSKNVTVTVL